MVRDELAMRELREQLARLSQISRPAGLGALQLDDADVDLWEEEAYFVGIAESVLRGGQVDQCRLELDASIDARLLQARDRGPTNEMLNALLAYRAAMRALHASLVKVLQVRP